MRTNHVVARSSRTFTLNLSDAGVELFLECHHRLCQHVGALLPYGQTLYCSVVHLEGIDSALILDDLVTLKRSGLLGEKACFMGAPQTLVKVTAGVAARIKEELPASKMPIVVTKLFVVALKRFRLAAPDMIECSYAHMIREAGADMKVPGHHVAVTSPS